MKKKWALTAGVAIGAFAAFAYAYSEAMFSLASRRRSRIYEREWKRHGGGYDRRILNLINDKSDALRAMELEKHVVLSHDGLRLVGHWYPAQNAKRTVILFHGWRSSWSHDFGIISEFLHANGCNLMLTEQRAQGDSEGEFISFGVLERYDAQTWVDYVSDRNEDKLPIYLSGLSMGASTVLMASNLPLREKLAGITADCGFTSPDAILRDALSNNTHLPVNVSVAAAERVGRIHGGFSFGDYSTVNSMRENTVPTLFVHGDADDFVPVRMTYENYEACAAPKDILIVHGAGHGMSYLIDRAAYEKKLLDFFSKHDAPAAAKPAETH